MAQAVALADKLEALAGMFGIGQVPTGDKDPFGLRRAALGVIRILIERRQHAALSGLVDLAFDAFNAVPAVARQPDLMLDFIYDRLRGYLRDQGYTANQISAVLDARPDAIDDLPARLQAVAAFAALPEAAALSAANKRIINILRKSGSEAASSVDRARLADGAEHDLFVTFQALTPQVETDYGNGDFAGALRALATAKPAVDRYFDDGDGDGRRSSHSRQSPRAAAWRRANHEPRRRHFQARPIMVQLASEAMVPHAGGEAHRARPRRRHQLRQRPVHQGTR